MEATFLITVRGGLNANELNFYIKKENLKRFEFEFVLIFRSDINNANRNLYLY